MFIIIYNVYKITCYFKINYTACLPKVMWCYLQLTHLALARFLEGVLTLNLCIINRPVVGRYDMQAGQNFIRNRYQTANEGDDTILWEWTKNIQILNVMTNASI